MKNKHKKPSADIVYLDSNVISFYFSMLPEAKFFRDATREWWKKRRADFFICSSPTAVEELGDGDYLHQEETLRFIGKVGLLPINDEIEELARFYIKNKLAPDENKKGFRGDAYHLAVCAFYKVDYLLSWNQRHLANVNKLKHLNRVNEKLGLHTPMIVTPLQLM